MLRIQPLSIKSKSDDIYIVRFERLVAEHSDCFKGEFEMPDGFVEYPFKFQTNHKGFRQCDGGPKQFDWDTHDDGTGAIWLLSAVSLLDLAKNDGVITNAEQIYKPFEIITNQLNEAFEHQYLVTFRTGSTTVQFPFFVSGNDQQLNISWKEGAHKANIGQRWTLDDEADRSGEGKLILSIAMLHAARNFIYGPDKEWEPANQ
jgi:hypothetical protein